MSDYRMRTTIHTPPVGHPSLERTQNRIPSIKRGGAQRRGVWVAGFAFMLALTGGLTAAERLHVTALKCEYAVNPLGVDAAPPRLSWQVASDERGQRQTAWQVLVASTP